MVTDEWSKKGKEREGGRGSRGSAELAAALMSAQTINKQRAVEQCRAREQSVRAVMFRGN